MTNQTALVCDNCGKVGVIRSTLREAIDAAQVRGWIVQKRDEHYVDLCIVCTEDATIPLTDCVLNDYRQETLPNV